MPDFDAESSDHESVAWMISTRTLESSEHYRFVFMYSNERAESSTNCWLGCVFPIIFKGLFKGTNMSTKFRCERIVAIEEKFEHSGDSFAFQKNSSLRILFDHHVRLQFTIKFNNGSAFIYPAHPADKASRGNRLTRRHAKKVHVAGQH